MAKIRFQKENKLKKYETFQTNYINNNYNTMATSNICIFINE